jgi:hypothetical protein|tara:strand:+ start:669 stop:893 length:225 start_codon:yes stop_codon:yes gene_type:complete
MKMAQITQLINSFVARFRNLALNISKHLTLFSHQRKEADCLITGCQFASSAEVEVACKKRGRRAQRENQYQALE